MRLKHDPTDRAEYILPTLAREAGASQCRKARRLCSSLVGSFCEGGHHGQQESVRKPEEPLCPAKAVNEAGGRAYKLDAKHALAQLAATGCFNGTYYAQADEQLATLKTLVDQVADNAFLAKLAVYSRERAMMKDMPVALLLALSKCDPALFRKVFDRVVDNGLPELSRRPAGSVEIVARDKTWPGGPQGPLARTVTALT